LHILKKTALLSATLITAAFAQRPPAFPVHPQADDATLERGKAIYGVNCNFCHGSDARGGEGGPNLLRSDLVLNDKNGELIGQVVLNGRNEMPAIKLTQPQIADVSAYLHDFKVGGYDISRMIPPSVVVGDAKAGEAYFQKTCKASAPNSPIPSSSKTLTSREAADAEAAEAVAAEANPSRSPSRNRMEQK